MHACTATEEGHLERAIYSCTTSRLFTQKMNTWAGPGRAVWGVVDVRMDQWPDDEQSMDRSSAPPSWSLHSIQSPPSSSQTSAPRTRSAHRLGPCIRSIIIIPKQQSD